MGALLDIRDLGVEFGSNGGRVRALRGVSISVAQGEKVALVGESGSGKTLSALALFRLLPPAARCCSGSILFRDRDVLAMPEGELRKLRGASMAMVFQEPLTALNPVFTVGWQVSEALLTHESTTRKEARARAIELLGLVGLPDPARRCDDYPHQMSGGQRQRAMIAMALACKPALLVADEPTTALDVTVQAQILDLLQKLGEELGMAVLLITHDLGVVARFAQRVYVLYAGLVLEEGAVGDIFGKPGHPYTRALLRSLPRMGEKDRRLRAIPGSVPAPGQAPPGCPFAPRCPSVQAVCSERLPDLEGRGPGRKVRCILSDEAAP